MQLDAFRLKKVQQPPEQAQIVSVAQLRPVLHVDALTAGVFRDDDHAPIRPVAKIAARAQVDRSVERLGPLVEEIERPDVDGASRQIDSRWRRGVDMHTE